MKGMFSGQQQQQQSSQQKGGYNRESDDSFFYDDFLNSQEIWLKLNEADRPQDEELIFQGRLWQKTGKQKKWGSYHFELYSDKIVRIDLTHHNKENSKSMTALDKAANNSNGTLPIGPGVTAPSAADPTSSSTTAGAAITVTPATSNNNNSNPEDTPLAVMEFIPINSCFLKKIKYSDNSYSNYKYGIRLQRGELKSELFTENADTFNKWHEEIKRYCILPKYSKKYKTLTKMKTQSLLPNSALLFKCFRLSDSNQYCARIIDKYSLSDQSKQGILKEIQILRKLDNPFLCRLYEIYEDENSIYIITELFQGKDLKSKLQEAPILDEKIISEIMWRLLQGLHHMHQRSIFHRDIKLENIQFRNPQNLADVCLTNFFMADFVDNKSKQGYKKCGTAGFIAPEIFKTKHYDQKVDIFSLGVVFYALVFGRMPFESQQIDMVIQLNETCEIDFSPQENSVKVTSSAIDLLKRMLAKDPAARSSAYQLVNHTWFINMKNRGDDGRMRNNFFGMPTLSTIQEGLSDIIDISSRQDFFYRRGENGQSNSSKVYEENNTGLETLNQKMTTLHSTLFSKFPSKSRHDLAISKIS